MSFLRVQRSVAGSYSRVMPIAFHPGASPPKTYIFPPAAMPYTSSAPCGAGAAVTHFCACTAPAAKSSSTRPNVESGLILSPRLLAGHTAGQSAACPRPNRRPGLKHALDFQRGKLPLIDAEPGVQHLGGVLPQCWRALDAHHLAVYPHRPRCHLVLAVMVLDGLHEPALDEARL